jgi:CBS domain-containing protein
MICPTCNFNNVPGTDQCANCQQDLAPLDRPVAIDRVQRSLMEDTVASLRPRPPVTLPPGATLAEAMAVLLDRNVGALPIVEAGELVGILTERDVLLKAAGVEGCNRRPVSDFMTRRPETVRENDTLAFALHKMDSGGYRHLPVTRDGRLVGIVSVRDLMRHVTRLCAVPRIGLLGQE